MVKSSDRQRNGVNRRIFLASATALAGLSLMPVKASFASDSKQEIVVAFGVDPTSLNPLASTSIPGRSAINHLFDKLIWFDADSNLVPKLAESWEFLEPTVLQLRLRQGVKWHDGRDFTAEDVKYTLDKARHPENPSWMTASFKPIKEVKVVDPHTVQIITEVPNRSLLRTISLIEIVSKAFFEENPKTVQTQPVGTGPFKFVSYTPGDRLVMERNPDYWGGAPKLERLTIRVIPESGTRLAELQAGSVDFIDNVPIDQIASVKAQDDLELLTGPSYRIMYLALTTQRDPMKKLAVRQAVHHAIDKQAIVDNLFSGLTKIANTPVPAGIPGHDDKIPALAYDPEKARALLREAGAEGTRIVVAYPSGRYLMDRQVGEAIAGYLLAAGFDVVQETPEWGIYATTMYTGGKSPYDTTFAGWGGDTGDPNWFLWQFFHSSSAVNQSGYANKQVDELLEKALQTLDDDAAMKLYQQVQEIVVPDSSWIPLYQQPTVWAKNKRLKGFDQRKDEFMIFTNAYVE